MLVKTLVCATHLNTEVLNLQTPTQYIGIHVKTSGIGTTLDAILPKLAESSLKLSLQSSGSVFEVMHRLNLHELADIIAQTESNVRFTVVDVATKKTDVYLFIPVSAFGALSLDADTLLRCEFEYKCESPEGTDQNITFDVYSISSIIRSDSFHTYIKMTVVGAGTVTRDVTAYSKMFIQKATLDTLKLKTASGETVTVNKTELQMMEAATGNINYMLTTPTMTSLQDAAGIVGLDITAIQEVEITTTDSATVYYIK